MKMNTHHGAQTPSGDTQALPGLAASSQPDRNMLTNFALVTHASAAPTMTSELHRAQDDPSRALLMDDHKLLPFVLRHTFTGGDLSLIQW